MRIEFRRPAGGERFDVAAVVAIDAEGVATSSGPDAATITAIAVPAPDGDGERIRFDEDPAAWIQNAHLGFRSRFLVPVRTS